MPSEKLEKSSNFVLKKFNIMEQNNSQAELVRESDEHDERSWGDVKWKEWLSIAVLCYVNLINYMDRFTVAGVLVDIQDDFKITDDRGGLLQTAFIVFYMCFGPLFGYLGDRYSRRYLMAFGVTLWSLTTLCGSFMTSYWWFLFFRATVGIGEASYSTIAPTIISDLFVGDIRSKMLALFYFAIPVGSGLGYIIGAETAKLFGSWHWALRVTPALGIFAVIFIILFLSEPERGAAEGTGHMESTSWKEDLSDICKNKTFVFTTAGFTCVAFVAGALSWWGPKFLEMGLDLQGDTDAKESVAFRFGVVAMVSGLLGVPTGSMFSQKLRHKIPRIDAYVCAGGLIVSCPFVFAAIYTARYYTTVCFSMIFLGMFFLNLTWAIVADMLLYVIMPVRRSTAEGFQLLVSHALGDAGSPYLIGVLSEAFRIMLKGPTQATAPALVAVTTASPTPSQDDINSYKALQYALFTTCFVEILGGFFFLLSAFSLLEDRKKVETAIQGNSESLLINEDQQPS